MQKKQVQKKTFQKKKNSGTTMLEVIIGFTILMILDAGFLKIINVSNEMYYKGIDIVRATEDFLAEFYKTDQGELTEETLSCSFTLQEVTADGTQTNTKLSMQQAQVKKYTTPASADDTDPEIVVYCFER